MAGLVPRSLDGLIPGRVAPSLACSWAASTGPSRPPGPQDADKFMLDLLVKEVVPLIDGRFRTNGSGRARAVVGAGVERASSPLRAAFGRRGRSGRWGCSRLALLDSDEAEISRRAANRRGAADARLPGLGPLRPTDHARRLEHARGEPRFNEVLRGKGYLPAGGEAPDGIGWASWRNRTDRLFEALFPPVR